MLKVALQEVGGGGAKDGSYGVDEFIKFVKLATLVG